MIQMICEALALASDLSIIHLLIAPYNSHVESAINTWEQDAIH